MGAPEGLQDRGRALWALLAKSFDLGGAQGVLAHEACRIADRLEQLDGLLSGEADVWARLVHDARTEDYELKIDSALSEARQQQMALKQVLAALGVEKAPAATIGGGSALDQLAARRAGRSAASAG